LLLCWYFIIVSSATEAYLKTKVQNPFYCSKAFGRAGTTDHRRTKLMLRYVSQHSSKPMLYAVAVTL
jgi:hypothetical protein